MPRATQGPARSWDTAARRCSGSSSRSKTHSSPQAPGPAPSPPAWPLGPSDAGKASGGNSPGRPPPPPAARKAYAVQSSRNGSKAPSRASTSRRAAASPTRRSWPSTWGSALDTAESHRCTASTPGGGAASQPCCSQWSARSFPTARASVSALDSRLPAAAGMNDRCSGKAMPLSSSGPCRGSRRRCMKPRGRWVSGSTSAMA
mmetsp:Transcript_2229/g.7496  ORF Transcript_2229/g.7496 Transcript_2229/m.7496 type:complete len:203 (-) Transcript_2229:554-1162(-)